MNIRKPKNIIGENEKVIRKNESQISLNHQNIINKLRRKMKKKKKITRTKVKRQCCDGTSLLNTLHHHVLSIAIQIK